MITKHLKMRAVPIFSKQLHEIQRLKLFNMYNIF